jgi:hypothetical protein
MTRRACPILLLFVVAGARGADPTQPAPVEFNRDVRRTLSDNCFACHGPDQGKRKAGLRLDTEAGAFADLGEGARPFVGGKPDASAVYRRITHKDPKRRMPPSGSGKALSREQIDLTRRWIEQGAKWQKHWALIPPKRAHLPAVADAKWPRNAVDRFILARLEREGLKPSPEADRRTLIRRLSFDLIGLPPTPAEVDAFLADKRPDAYEKLVERLLASKHHGERLALYWLDLVRYGDTGGYHSDNHRDVWLYRDYVIDAFNANMPFDRFTREQLAGDLLPKATQWQRIASGYNKLLMTTEEGGAQPKEYTAKYAADRVRNASTVWLGLTMGCAECHNHKFDPVTSKEFYRFASFFADVQEVAVGRQPQVKFPTPEQAARLRALEAELAAAQKVVNTVTPEIAAAQARWEEAERARLTKTPPGPPRKGGLPDRVVKALLADPTKRAAPQKELLASYYRGISPLLEPARRKLADVQRRKAALDAEIPQSLVTVAIAPRVVRVLPRGNWLDDSGEIVTPGVPASLAPLIAKRARATRLDLGNWLTAPDNPLVARVFVNRLWKLFFGQGIVTTLDDFGSQGAWPTHPELLDWLAVEFRESGWDVRHVVQTIVLSSAYRQASRAPEALRHRDPYNQRLARQGRWRLDAELVRDNALAVSGLLAHKLGGPSVKPYQPAGYWAYLNFPTREWFPDRGESQYRRGLYTYVQRTFPHPSLIAFDGSSREECIVERTRSNNPLQALVLLNDPTYVESARVLAQRVLREGGTNDQARLRFAFRQVLQRDPRPAETKLLSALLRRHLTQYGSDRAAVNELLNVGFTPVAGDVDRQTLAAWTSAARVLLNLHETIMRE